MRFCFCDEEFDSLFVFHMMACVFEGGNAM